MKNKLIPYIILFVIALGFFNIAYKVLPTANATNVEGTISQDTLWTLVDSPYIVTNNITVNPGVTLTIEPGVEVRFGGDFSLNILGTILAQGTPEKTILFTTNDLTNQDYWQSISISGTQATFTYCTIEYATNGTVLESGSLEILETNIQSNLENGIVINGGTANINDCEFAFNGESAIQVSGGNPVTITNNFINSDMNGLTLSNHLTGTIQVQNNLISNNTQAGIVLAADAFTNTQIIQNNITANDYGFLVQSKTTTHITQNFIYANSLGVYYTGAGSQQIDFNDIYDNGIGVDLQTGLNVSINAIHNYWGDKTGPNHEWLNPHGKGNLVGGDGINLEFMPFLAHSFTYSNVPPNAALWTDVVTAAVGQTATFVGTDSTDDGIVESYYFDFNDTANSGWTTLSLFNHTYTTIGTYQPFLIVQDDAGWWSLHASTTVNVVNLTPLQTSVTVSNSTVAYNGQTWVTAYVSNATGPVANATVSLFSVAGGTFDSQSGLTDANGYFATMFTAPNVTEPVNARIIARASMTGYADGSDHTYVRVLSPLQVQISPQSLTLESQANATLNIRVTDNFDDPVQNANLTVSSDSGTIAPMTGMTDSNGTVTFTYQAPLTLSQLNSTVTVTATKSGFADGTVQTIIDVEPKLLSLTVTANPNTVFSEDTSTITAIVTSDSTVVTNAIVTVSSDSGGNFSNALLYTDLTGTARFAFTAPQTVAPYGINTTITVMASKDGFVSTQNQVILLVTPKTLDVQIMSNNDSTYSGGQLNVTVKVGYGGNPIENANVTLSAMNGTFAPTIGVTDKNGNATFTFTAPEVADETNITISAIGTKDGYIQNTDQFNVTVKLRTFAISVSPATVQSGQTQVITIHVTCKEDLTVTEGAIVTIAFENGQQISNVTDATGTGTFLVNVPSTSANIINMTVTATRIGYVQKVSQITLNAVPQEAGFPWLLILIIAIPVAIVVIIVVLIKMKIVVFSSKEDEGSE